MAADTGEKDKRHRYLIPLFITNLSLLLLFHMVNVAYLGVVVRTLEKRFGLRSSQTGLLFGCNDVMHTVIVLFVGFFGRQSHKPRIISVTVMFSGLSCLMMVIPHWMSGSSTSVESHANDVSNTGSLQTTSTNTSSMFCPLSALNTSRTETECDSTATGSGSSSGDRDSTTHSTAFYVFVVAQLISGLGSSGLATMGVTYIDENVSKSQSSTYIGIVSSMYAIGPVCCYLLAGFVLTLPENLLTPTTLKPEDPTFIGCWWLGYLICGVTIVLLAIPMWFFPKSYNDGTSDDSTSKLSISAKNDQQQETKRIANEVKEFPRTMRKLLRNKPYFINVLWSLSQSYIIMGVNANIVRHVEINFRERAFVASIIAALATIAGAVGAFAGGFIMSRKRLNPPGGVRMMIGAGAAFSLGVFVTLFLSCQEIPMAGNIDPRHNTYVFRKQACIDRSPFNAQLICGSDNLTYFSACFAGCTIDKAGEHVGCACISKSNQLHRSSLPHDFSGTAHPGLCVPACKLLVPFGIVMSLTFLFGNMAIVPATMVNLRVVDRDERSLALAICSFTANLLGFFPAPMLYGRLIDSSCRMWQRFAAIPSTSSSCGHDPLGGDTGSCLLYDTAKLRQRVYGTALAFKLLDVLLAVVMYVFIRRRTFVDEPDVEDEVSVKSGTSDFPAKVDWSNVKESVC